ncbi:LysR family transcriptional regulator [Methylobacterium persicinum]|uniref:DNA-binding transcriptional LysR family regulator n=1 Tax=Methylobacterium persicinum TaxID=374426 RepID=A0ABU0HN58_9HYPH|nr:LysR family transcriptional regulator [Methylobacterium persicinum]MDQ0443746.1 DNA-binding transcriptional LysR family regulator [Methylobacterium persicinum]GJE40128.1 HTH-type transcriptional regulator CynR [Methylobacterium persicinum]
MKLPVDGVQAFVQIAELGSYRRAAEALGLTQTALTRRIQKLEGFLGLTLLDRTTRTVRLSPMGEEFLPLAARLIADFTHGIERLRTTSRLAVGDVTVATIQSIAFRRMPNVLRAYACDYPQNRVQILERSGALVTEAVRKGEADFGIHIQQEPDADLVEDRLVCDPFVLICHRGHPLAGRGAVRWAELGDADLITLGGASGNRHRVEAQLRAAGQPPRGRFVVESTPTAFALVSAGIGAAILPAALQGASQRDDLVAVLLIEPEISRTISLVRRRNTSLTPAAAAFYEMLRVELSGGFG